MPEGQRPYPDTDATCWTTPYRSGPDYRQGTRSQTRVSCRSNTYDSTGGAFTTNNVPGAIFDHQISPNPGPTNPYQHTTRRSGKFRGDVIRRPCSNGFKVRVQSDVPGSQPNTIPRTRRTAEAASASYHAGVPPRGANFNAIKLPSISIITASGTRTITPCSPKKQKSPNAVIPGPDADVQAAVRNIAARIADEGNPATGPVPTQRAGSALEHRVRPRDCGDDQLCIPELRSAYVSALSTPNPNCVVLVRAKAPRTPALRPPGTQLLPWPTKKYQLPTSPV